MTEQEFLKKYGDVKVEFVSYYKFTFNFKGFDKEDNLIEIGIGGNSDEIYRLDIEPETPYKIGDLHTQIVSVNINGTWLSLKD